MFKLTDRQSQRFTKLVILMILLGLGVSGFLWSLSQNLNLFFTPDQLYQSDIQISKNMTIRIGGLVVPGSLVRDAIKKTRLQFEICDARSEKSEKTKTITVEYSGVLPDLFRENQMIVALGQYAPNQKKMFAKQILARHDENYRPPMG